MLPLAEDADGHVAVGALAAVADTAGSSDAVLVGPGLDEPDGARDLVAGIADAVGPEAFVVLDAFALGVAADVEDRLAPLHGRLVLTPNSGEAERLLGGTAGTTTSPTPARSPSGTAPSWRCPTSSPRRTVVPG